MLSEKDNSEQITELLEVPSSAREGLCSQYVNHKFKRSCLEQYGQIATGGFELIPGQKRGSCNKRLVAAVTILLTVTCTLGSCSEDKELNQLLGTVTH